MTVAENLEMGGFVYRSDKNELHRRVDRVYELFPALRTAEGSGPTRSRAGSNRCRPWASPCCTTPPSSMIDELSLGLAPIIVQELIGVIDGLKAAGETLIIVDSP